MYYHKANFIENIEIFCKEKNIDSVLDEINNQLKLLKNIELNFNHKKWKILNRTPEIKKNLATLNFLLNENVKSNNNSSRINLMIEEKHIHFELMDNTFVKAKSECDGRIHPRRRKKIFRR